MEPSYVGRNGRIDANAVAWLFDNDVLFFNPDEIQWDGAKHSIAGIQINAGAVDQVPVFMEEYQMLVNGVVDLLLELEKDGGLHVPRQAIHTGLHTAIREGDLTGITLFNLIACGHAIKIAQNTDNSYMVIYDNRLARGIPGFYALVGRMLADMRAYNELSEPFDVTFASARNVDADAFLEQFEDAVAGAVSEPVHMESFEAVSFADTADEAVRASADAADAIEAEALEEQADSPEDAARAAAIALLQLAVLADTLKGTNKIDEETRDKLQRAADGDMSIDLDELGAIINAELPDLPDSEGVNLDDVSFDAGGRVEGRRFSVAVPDGWTALKGYEEQTFMGTQVRPFVIVQGAAESDDDVSLKNRIIYSSLIGDTEIDDDVKRVGTSDYAWALRYYNAYYRGDDGFEAMKPVIVWDKEVQAVNTKCLVCQQQSNSTGPNGLEFDIHPYALDYADNLRLVFNYEEDDAYVEQVRELAIQMAQTIELDKPFVSECEKQLQRALAGKIEAEAFKQMSEGIATPLMATGQMVYTASQYKHVIQGGATDENGIMIAGAQGLAELNRRAEGWLVKLLDAYDVQVAAGATIGELDVMLEGLSTFDNMAFSTPDKFEDDIKQVIEGAGTLDPSDELLALRERLAYAKEHPGSPSVPKGAKVSAAVATVTYIPNEEKTQRENKSIVESYKTAGLPRLEKALNEVVSSAYYIETSELIANELMTKRQEACSKVTSDFASDEDNVTNMAREFGKFNAIICRYYGYFVDVLESQIELGATPAEVKKMAVEANEFSELVADRFSCGNAHLDDVANRRAPVKRPAEYTQIRTRWQSIHSR